MSLVESKPVYADADQAKAKNGKIGSTMKKSAMDVGDGFGDALAAPLEDLNLRRDDIPAILIRASTKTYDLTGMERCEGIAAEVRRLDEVLGDDFDEPPPPESDMTEKVAVPPPTTLWGLCEVRRVTSSLCGDWCAKSPAPKNIKIYRPRYSGRYCTPRLSQGYWPE